MKKILYSILIILIIILIVLLYAHFIGPTNLKTNEISYQTNNIDISYNGLKIIHFSDLHYSKNTNKKSIYKLIKEIKRIKPDLVLFTGDLINDNTKLDNKDTNFLINQLSLIKSTYGNYAIFGDSDYLKSDTIKNIYIQSNFNLLNNNYSIIHNSNNKQIFIGGVSSYNYEDASIDTIMNYFSDNPDIKFKIIMIHEGDYAKEIIDKYNNIDLIVGGHSINGSINIPILKNFLLPKGSHSYYKPHYKTNNTNIYISNGIGFNTYNFRLFNHPSLNFYRIKRK